MLIFLIAAVYSVLVLFVGKTLFKCAIASYVFYVLTVSVGVSMLGFFVFFPDALSMPYRQYVLGVFATVFLSILVYALVYVVLSLVRLFFEKRKSLELLSVESKKSRRNFIKTMSWALAAIPFSSMIYAMVEGRYRFQVIKHVLYFDNLPKSFEGYRITHISDIHSGSFDDREKIERAIQLINQQNSDVILFTGDLVNIRAEEMIPWKDLFSRLRATDGCYSVLGNHDYGDYAQWEDSSLKEKNLDLLKQIHNDIGFKLLLNAHSNIYRAEDKIVIAGVENWGAGRFSKYGDLEKTFEGVDNDSFKILMSHDPTHWQYKVLEYRNRVDLTLSGHTHGMQFGIEIPGKVKWSPAGWIYKYWAGLYKEGEKYLNVNRGFGYLAFPGRLGVWPEITVIELKKKVNV